MNVVLDANVYVSAMISPTGAPAQVIRGWEDEQFEVVVSPAIMDELGRVLNYPHLVDRYQQIKENRSLFLATLQEAAIMAHPDITMAVIAADESDNRYLECAVAGRAQYLVTGDPHLLQVQTYQDVVILAPTTFLALLQSGQL